MATFKGLVSGMSFGLVFKGEPYSQYVWKRVKRLLFPVWIFLTIYFSFLFVFEPSEADLSYYTIFASYFLIGGIGYVWIIRVFLLVALVAPFIYLLHKNTKSDSIYLIGLLSAYFIYEICRYLSMPYISEGFGEAFSLIVFYMIPYSIIFAFGLRILQIPTRGNTKLLCFFLLCFVGFAFLHWYKTGSFVPMEQYKYPPSIYYFSYAITVSIFLWIASDGIWKTLEKIEIVKKIVLFVAQNSIWIYLWHIPLVKAIHANFALKYFIVFLVSICITFCQVWFVNSILVQETSSARLKKKAQYGFQSAIVEALPVTI